MKRKFLFSLTALATVALASFTAYKSFTPQLSEADILLNENIEALTRGELGGLYKRSSGRCSIPCEYKNWVSCKTGGNSDCYPSDCC